MAGRPLSYLTYLVTLGKALTLGYVVGSFQGLRHLTHDWSPSATVSSTQPPAAVLLMPNCRLQSTFTFLYITSSPSWIRKTRRHRRILSKTARCLFMTQVKAGTMVSSRSVIRLGIRAPSNIPLTGACASVSSCQPSRPHAANTARSWPRKDLPPPNSTLARGPMCVSSSPLPSRTRQHATNSIE